MTNRATQAELLEQRIAENRAAQEVDLVNWIFDRIAVRKNDQVLELCCGTGGQTLRILRALDDGGRVYALDVSREALETLLARAGADQAKLVPVESSMCELSSALQRGELRRPAFDLIFCAYGLYYSDDAAKTLDEALSWLKKDGRIVVVGPFGPNNGPLFDLVRASGAMISDAVISSSERFMTAVVVPWGAVKFQCIRVRSVVNPVRWETPERVLNYWKNTTFYSAEHQPEFETRLQRHFSQHGEFVNEKWVMMVEMVNVRP